MAGFRSGSDVRKRESFSRWGMPDGPSKVSCSRIDKSSVVSSSVRFSETLRKILFGPSLRFDFSLLRSVGLFWRLRP